MVKTDAPASETSSRGAINTPAVSRVFKAKDLHSKSFKVINEFFEDEFVCDVEIKCGSRRFKCHRVILASFSEYFKKMFTRGIIESRSLTIEIKDIDEDVMHGLIKFAYTSEILLNVDNVRSVLYTSLIFQVQSVTHACCEFMAAQLHPNNCIDIHDFANLHNITDLMKRADEYIQENFAKCVESKEFVTMTRDHLEMVLSSPDLNVHNETQVFEALMKWTNHDLASRKFQLAGLLANVKLVLLPVDYLLQRVSADALIESNLICRSIVEEAKYYHLSSVQPQQIILPRKSCAGVLLCVGGRGLQGHYHKSVECFNLRKNSWFHVKPMLTKRHLAGVVSAKNKVYGIGGHDGSDHLSSGEVFDPIQNEWALMPSMSIKRRALAIACLGGQLYAIGGQGCHTCYSIVERYDLKTNSWSFVGRMTHSRYGVAAATLGGYIYVVGGNNMLGILKSCERYNPQFNEWTMCASMNMRRVDAGMAELNGYLYVVGGFDGKFTLNSGEKYDPNANRWTTIDNMSCPRRGVGVAALSGKIYAIGGHDGSYYLRSVEAYDPSTNTWDIVASIAKCRSGPGMTTIMCHVDELTSVKKNRTLKSARK